MKLIDTARNRLADTIAYNAYRHIGTWDYFISFSRVMRAGSKALEEQARAPLSEVVIRNHRDPHWEIRQPRYCESICDHDGHVYDFGDGKYWRCRGQR